MTNPGAASARAPVLADAQLADDALELPRRRRRANARVVVGGTLIAVLILAALGAPLLAPYDPVRVTTSSALQPPSLAHLIGTDDLGRDVFSRVVWGARISLSVGVISVSIGLLVGV